MLYKDKDKRREYDRRYRKRTAALQLCRYAKRRAIRDKIEHTITVNDIVMVEVCPVLGIPLVIGGNQWNSPTLDRIRNSLGYVPGNVWVISGLANSMKSYSTSEQRVLFAIWIIKTHTRNLLKHWSSFVSAIQVHFSRLQIDDVESNLVLLRLVQLA